MTVRRECPPGEFFPTLSEYSCILSPGQAVPFAPVISSQTLLTPPPPPPGPPPPHSLRTGSPGTRPPRATRCSPCRRDLVRLGMAVAVDLDNQLCLRARAGRHERKFVSPKRNRRSTGRSDAADDCTLSRSRGCPTPSRESKRGSRSAPSLSTYVLILRRGPGRLRRPQPACDSRAGSGLRLSPKPRGRMPNRPGCRRSSRSPR